MSSLPTVLCVDDEPNVLEGLSLSLRRKFEVVTATSGLAGLTALRERPGIAVVISDMRMPSMNGARFLAHVREHFPDAVKILLTGHTDIEAAIAAVNDGQIFRFLTKPCAPATLVAAVEAAAEQNRLLTAERVLLEQTLLGSIRVLTDVLALTNPSAFGRGSRIKQLATAVAGQLEMKDVWQLEVAAMLSQLGQLILPVDTVERVRQGAALTSEETQMVERAPAVTEQLLAHIPRLENVRAILTEHARPHRPAQDASATKTHVVRCAEVLRAAIDFDTLESQGHTAVRALDTMRGHLGRYDTSVLEALGALRARGAGSEEVRDLAIGQLRVGMRFVTDVKLANGALFVARGYEISTSFLERVRGLPKGTLKEPVRVVLPPET